MNIQWDKKYTALAVYAFLVLAGVVVLFQVLQNIPYFADKAARLLNVLSPFILGFVFAYLLNPLLHLCEGWLGRGIAGRRLRRNLAIGVSYLIAGGCILAFGLVVIPQMTTSIFTIAANMTKYMTTLESWAIDIIDRFAPTILQVDSQKLVADMVNLLTETLQSLLPKLVEILTGITATALNVVLGIIISMYMLSGKERFFAQTKRMLHAMLPKSRVNALIAIAHESNSKFSSFISGKILDSAIIGVLCFLGMTIFRMPNAMLISTIIGITNVIPYFGPFIGAIPGFLLVLIVSPEKSLYFLLFILALQQFDGNILGPKILGDSLGLSAIWVIFAIVVFGSQLGVLGMFIGVPLFAVIYSIIQSFIHYNLSKKGMPTDITEYASSEHTIID